MIKMDYFKKIKALAKEYGKDIAKYNYGWDIVKHKFLGIEIYPKFLTTGERHWPNNPKVVTNSMSGVRTAKKYFEKERRAVLYEGTHVDEMLDSSGTLGSTYATMMKCAKCGKKHREDYMLYDSGAKALVCEKCFTEPKANPPNRTFKFGPRASELQFAASLGVEGKNQAFIEELKELGYDVGTDADYALPKSFYTIIVRCNTEDVPEIRNTAIKYGIKSKNPTTTRFLAWEIKP